MDVRYINPFITAAKDAFDVMLKMPCLVGPPHLRSPGEKYGSIYELSACIDMAGGANGFVMLSFGRQVALSVASALAQTPIKVIDRNCVDALGELANLIGGGAKSNLPDAGDMKLGTPRVVHTAKFGYPVGVPVIALHCDTPSGRFLLEIGLTKTSAAPVIMPPAVAA